jgi:hypothetical protein
LRIRTNDCELPFGFGSEDLDMDPLKTKLAQQSIRKILSVVEIQQTLDFDGYSIHSVSL